MNDRNIILLFIGLSILLFISICNSICIYVLNKQVKEIMINIEKLNKITLDTSMQVGFNKTDICVINGAVTKVIKPMADEALCKVNELTYRLRNFI